MNINFPPVDEKFIRQKVEDGFYSNATELVRDAVRRLREGEAKHSTLWEAVRAGEEDIEAGRLHEYTPELMQEIARNARKKAELGLAPHPDVLP